MVYFFISNVCAFPTIQGVNTSMHDRCRMSSVATSVNELQ
jgi:hypothetical protein